MRRGLTLPAVCALVVVAFALPVWLRAANGDDAPIPTRSAMLADLPPEAPAVAPDKVALGPPPGPVAALPPLRDPRQPPRRRKVRPVRSAPVMVAPVVTAAPTPAATPVPAPTPTYIAPAPPPPAPAPTPKPVAHTEPHPTPTPTTSGDFDTTGGG